MYKTVSAAEALKIVKSDDKIYLQAAAAAPNLLIRASTNRCEDLRNIEICQLYTESDAPYSNPVLAESFHVNSFFIGKNVRHTLKASNGSDTLVFLSEVPLLLKRNIIGLNVALIHVSVPDIHGYCSLGTSIETTLAAIDNVDHVIAQVNKQMPRTFGDGIIHVTEINAFVECDEPLTVYPVTTPTEVETKIGNYLANLIEDRSTLQIGIGNIPNAILSRLHNHKDLGLHIEMFSDGVIDLILKDIINGNYKGVNLGRALATFLMGSQRLYTYVNDNPYVEMRTSDYVNDVSVIKQNPRMVAINYAIELDVTGQVCVDSIGSKIYSGVGGQMDFIREASLSEGGKAIIALPSITKRGLSRLVSSLKLGAGVATTRAHIHYVVTEYGVANLIGKTIKERVKAFVNIAHSDHREAIDKARFEMV
jgi:acyl-CoA hydrolase